MFYFSVRAEIGGLCGAAEQSGSLPAMLPGGIGRASLSLHSHSNSTAPDTFFKRHVKCGSARRADRDPSHLRLSPLHCFWFADRVVYTNCMALRGTTLRLLARFNMCISIECRTKATSQTWIFRNKFISVAKALNLRSRGKRRFPTFNNFCFFVRRTKYRDTNANSTVIS